MERIYFLGALLAVPVAALAADESYVIDPTHSQPTFEVQHMGGFSNQRGSFGKLSGKIVLDRAAKKGSIDATIDTTSIRSFSTVLDGKLKGDEFFNTDKYPTITFKATNLSFDGDKLVGASGDLTLLGVTKPATLKVASFTCGEQPFNKKPMCGAEATATIKRSEWGMNSNLKAASDEVKLTIPVEAYRE
ncbi:MAG: YceI family protein [Casimicrobiaceae bacterium]